jgi:hypothetical protein
VLIPEAEKLTLLLQVAGGEDKSLVNLGSQTLEFRETHQPWVASMFLKLEPDYRRVVHVDITRGHGVDYALDLMNPRDVREAIELGDVFLISNLLEHLEDPQIFMSTLAAGGKGKGKTYIFSGPSSFPYHPDPLDNRFRPKGPEDFQRISTESIIEDWALVSSFHFWKVVGKSLPEPVRFAYRLAAALGSLLRAVASKSTEPMIGWIIPAKAFVTSVRFE